MRVSVVIPAFNEEGNIGRLIEETFAKVPVDALGEVLAVDDGSDDGTGAEIKALLSKYKALRYLRHGRRSGQAWQQPASPSSPPWTETGRTILATSPACSPGLGRLATNPRWLQASEL